MVNKIVTIGGKERPVNFGRNALIEVELLTGLSTLELQSGKGVSRVSYTYMRALAYAGLKWGLYKDDGKEPQPKFSLFDVGSWLEDDDLGPTGPMAQIMTAFTESMPKSKNVGAEASLPQNGTISTEQH